MCLTSKAAQTALDEYLSTHPRLHDEIKEWMEVVHGAKDHSAVTHQDQVTDEVDDDVDILLSAIICEAFRLHDVEILARVDTCQRQQLRGPPSSPIQLQSSGVINT